MSEHTTIDFNRSAAEARLSGINPDLPPDAVTVIIDAMQRGLVPESAVVLAWKVATNDKLPNCELRQFSEEWLARTGGVAEYRIQIKSGRLISNAFRVRLDPSWAGATAPAAPPAARPVGVEDRLLAALDGITRRIEAIESRVAQPATPRPAGTDAMEMVKTVAAMMEAMRGMMPKTESILTEIEKLKALKDFIGEQGSVAAGDVDRDGRLTEKIVDAVGPHLPKLVEALSVRLAGKPAPVRRAPEPQRTAAPAAPLRLTESMGATPAPLPAPPSSPPPPPDATEPSAEQVAEQVMRSLCPEIDPGTLIDAIAKMAEAGEDVDAVADTLLDELDKRDPNAAMTVCMAYKPGEIASLLVGHPRLAAHAAYLEAVERSFRDGAVEDAQPQEPARSDITQPGLAAAAAPADDDWNSIGAMFR